MIQEIGDKVFDNQFRAGMKASAGDRVFIFEKEHSHIALGETAEGDILIPKI